MSEEDKMACASWYELGRKEAIAEFYRLGRKEAIAEFIQRLHIIHRKIIEENLKRNMKAEDHVEYNDHFNIEIKKWEDLLNA